VGQRFRYRERQPSEGAFADLERWERRIEGQMLLSLAVGMLLGAVTALLRGALPRPVIAMVDPYLLMTMVIVTGRLSLGFGWALVNSALATFGVLISQLTVMAVIHGESPLDYGGGGGGLNRLLFLMVLSGALAYLTRWEGAWGDVATAALAALFLVDAMGHVIGHLHAVARPAWQWAGAAAITLGLACVAVLRPELRPRLRTFGIALVPVAVYGAVVVVRMAL
jgi:hypothetical protein